MNPRDLLSLFAAFADVAPDVIDLFAAKYPELVDPPPPEPAGDLDPDVAAAIERGDL